MKTILVVDLTHGGTIIASELSKKSDAKILAWDLYHTLDGADEDNLRTEGIELVDDNFLSHGKGKRLTRRRCRPDFMNRNQKPDLAVITLV